MEPAHSDEVVDKSLIIGLFSVSSPFHPGFAILSDSLNNYQAFTYCLVREAAFQVHELCHKCDDEYIYKLGITRSTKKQLSVMKEV